MEDQLSNEVLSYLDSTQGKVFLSTEDGRKFLKNEISIQWISTQIGRNWIESKEGQKWITEEGNLIMNIVSKDLSLLKCSNIRKWLKDDENGQHWLYTGQGVSWLQSEDGQEYLRSSDGLLWLQVPKEIIDLIAS